MLPAGYVAAHVELGYASTVHAAQGVTADAAHGIVTGAEDRQLLYTMLSRGRLETPAPVIAESLPAGEEPMLPGVMEQLTATETLEAILARDGAARSATADATQAVAPATQLHQSVLRYADAVEHATRAIVGSHSDDALEAAGPGPLPWLPGIPADVAHDATWGPYLSAHAERINRLAAEVREHGSLPEQTEWLTGRLPAPTRDGLVVWRAAHGVPDDDPILLGRIPAGSSGGGYARRLQHQVDECVPPAVRRWDALIAKVVGHHDAHTVQLAHQLEQLRQQGHDAAHLLRRAAHSGALPDDHSSEALAYRVQRLVTQSQAVDPWERHRPPQPGRGLGF